MEFKRIVIAKDVDINISGEVLKFDIFRNQEGNLEVVPQNWDYQKHPDGIYYDMLNNELTLSTNLQ